MAKIYREMREFLIFLENLEKSGKFLKKTGKFWKFSGKLSDFRNFHNLLNFPHLPIFPVNNFPKSLQQFCFLWEIFTKQF